MKKDIKDYLHLYIGCDCKVVCVNETVKNNFAPLGSVVKFDDTTFYIVASEDVLNIKLILRPLSDITEEEKIWLLKFEPTYSSLDFLTSLTVDAQITHYLLSKGFDLFGLCEAGLAIDSTTLKQKV